jgi:hypothetical protein
MINENILEKVQKTTFRYFWNFSCPVSGMAYDRLCLDGSPAHEAIAVGGTGFGIMAMIVAVERDWIERNHAVDRINKIINFIFFSKWGYNVLPHFLNAKAEEVKICDEGTDLVETSYLLMGLICAREYFDKRNFKEAALRLEINTLLNSIPWNEYVENNCLHWHKVPSKGLIHAIHGWNECLITYVLATGNWLHGIDSKAYDKGWSVYMPPRYDTPLFFTHYSFMGLDPRQLKDKNADYNEYTKQHTEYQYKYCKDNLCYKKGYWGLTSCDTDTGYKGCSTKEDYGVIAPTAAISSIPYKPEKSYEALQAFMNTDQLWGILGFRDSFKPCTGWISNYYLAIDQAPQIVMIENYRTRLLWQLFMKTPEIRVALKKLNFEGF